MAEIATFKLRGEVVTNPEMSGVADHGLLVAECTGVDELGQVSEELLQSVFRFC